LAAAVFFTAGVFFLVAIFIEACAEAQAGSDAMGREPP
jgi:hypothetical protein